MACIIKLAELNGYHTFNSEEEALQFIEDNKDNITIERIKDADGNEKEMLVLDPKLNRNRRAEKVLQLSGQDAWNAVKEVREQMDSDEGFDSEEYNRLSPVVGVGNWLKQYREIINGESQRLFPEYISANYLNVETQNQLIEVLYSDEAHDTEEIRHKYFKNPDDSTDTVKLSAKEWYSEYIRNGGRKTITDDLLQKVDEYVDNIHIKNFKSLLFGEIYHKLIEYSENDSLSTEKIIEDLFKDFRAKYSNFEGNEFKDVINHVYDLFSKNNFSLANKYRKHAKAQIGYIIDELKKKYPRARIEKPLHEVRLINKLKNEIQRSKKYISAKLDLVFLIDGVPTVVDVKVSRKKYNKDSAKGKKIQFTMATYNKMLSQTGLNADIGESYLLEVQLFDESDDPSKEGQIDSSTSFTNITQEVNSVRSRLKGMFDTIEFNQKIDISSVTDDIKKLFGEYSREGQRQSTIEEIKNSLGVYPQQDGTYHIVYFLKDKGQSTTRREKNITKDQLDAKKEEIAQKIYEKNQTRYLDDFEFFKSTFKRYLSGQISLNEFKTNSSEGFQKHLVANLTKYKNDCRLIENPIFDDLGIMVIDTPAGVDVICLSENSPYAEWDITDKSATLFSNIDVSSDIPKTVGYVNIAKILLLMNEVLSKLDTKTGKLGEIKVMRLNHPKTLIPTSKQIKEIISVVSTHSSQKINRLENAIADPFINVLWQFVSLYDSNNYRQPFKDIFEKIDDKDKSVKDALKNQDLEAISALAHNPLLEPDQRLEILKLLRDQLENNFPAYLSGDPAKYGVNEITGLYQIVVKTISIYENTELMCESDAALWNPNTGIMIDSIDQIGNQNIQVVREVTSRGYDEISRRYNEGFLPYMRKQISSFEEGIGYSGIRKTIIGDGANRFNHLFRRDSSGNLLNGELILKNPWANDPKLSDSDRKFLKFVLFTLNKYNNPAWKSVDDMNEDSLSESDYYLPLVRGKNVERFVHDGKFRFPNLRATWEEMNTRAMGIRDDFSDRIQHRMEVSDLFKSVYNEHEYRRDPKTRETLLSKYGVDAFSMDIETVLMTYVISMESADVLNNQVIPTVRSVVFSMSYQEDLSGTRLDNIIQFVKKYSKSVIYDDVAFDEEYKKYMKYYMPLRTAASAIALGWNISNIPRELIMGIFSTISRSMFGTYGEETFSITDYTKALATMSYDTVDFVRKVTKIELLNEHFRMTNMSISELPEQTTSNKTGFAQMFSRWMGWALVAPDYFNRMTMFIAQMMHDGSWDAYSVDETEEYLKLKYDMSKDKRFDVFCTYKGCVKNVPTALKKKFLKQQSLYEAMRDEFNKNEGRNLAEPFKETESGEIVYNDNDTWMLPRAYTLKERDSLKSFSDTTFGYYDKETKSWFYKTAFGVLFKQFMAYGSSKKMQYLKTRTDKTARGSFKQLTTNSGEKIWKINVVGENGKEVALNVTESELNTKYSAYKDNAREVLVWTGTFVEGILNSYWNLFKEIGIATHEFATKPDGRNLAAKRFKTIYKEYIKKGDIRHSNLLQLPWDIFLSMCFMWIIRMCFFDDPEKSGTSYKTQLSERSWGMQMGYRALEAATVDFNFLAILKEQYLEANLPSLSIIANCAQRFWNAFGDPDLTLSQELGKGLITSVGLFKPIRPLAESWFE